MIGESASDGFGALPRQPNLFINGDKNSDLVVGASLADSTTTGLDAGKIYTFFSQFRGTPAISNLTEISTMSVPGSGDFLAETGIGVYEFKNNGQYYQLQAGNRDQWFRFTTLGDGLSDNGIRVIPELVLGNLSKLKVDLINDKGQLIRIGGAQCRSRDPSWYLLRARLHV